MQHTGARIFVLSQIFLKIQRFEIGEMEVEHPVHSKGTSPEWVPWWFIKRSEVEKDHVQVMHWNGYSPKCIEILCLLKVYGLLKVLTQFTHLWFLESNWTSNTSIFKTPSFCESTYALCNPSECNIVQVWILSFFCDVQFWQLLHSKGTSPEWVPWWFTLLNGFLDGLSKDE